jgi:hypothetical protein
MGVLSHQDSIVNDFTHKEILRPDAPGATANKLQIDKIVSLPPLPLLCAM